MEKAINPSLKRFFNIVEDYNKVKAETLANKKEVPNALEFIRERMKAVREKEKVSENTSDTK